VIEDRKAKSFGQVPTFNPSTCSASMRTTFVRGSLHPAALPLHSELMLLMGRANRFLNAGEARASSRLRPRRVVTTQQRPAIFLKPTVHLRTWASRASEITLRQTVERLNHRPAAAHFGFPAFVAAGFPGLGVTGASWLAKTAPPVGSEFLEGHHAGRRAGFCGIASGQIIAGGPIWFNQVK